MQIKGRFKNLKIKERLKPAKDYSGELNENIQ